MRKRDGAAVVHRHPTNCSELVPAAALLGIEEYRLPNGLRVVLAPDGSKPTFTVNLTVLVGSVHEGAGEAGMAHVFEHLLFRSLKGFPDVKETLTGMGGECNGTTSFDRTNFFETLEAGDANLELAVRLEAARLGGALLKTEDLGKEASIVEGEFDMRETFPQSLLWRAFLGVMYDFHPYARDPIGTVEDFKALRMADIRSFYRRHYAPDNAVLFITGRFDRGKALGLVRQHFGPLKAAKEKRRAVWTREPDARGERRFTVRGAGDAAHVVVGYRIPGAACPATAAAHVLCDALVSDRTGFLYEATVGKGLAANVNIACIDLRMAFPYFAMAQVPKGADSQAVEDAMVGAFEEKASLLTRADLDRAKARVEHGFDAVFNDPGHLAGMLSLCEAAGSWKLILVRRELAKALTLDAVKAFASRYLRRENRVVGRFEPDASSVPVRMEPEADISSYAGLLSKVPASTGAVKEFSYAPSSLQAALRWTGAGLVEVGFIRKETKGDDVFVRVWIPFAGRAEVRPFSASGSALGRLMCGRTAALSKDDVQGRLGEWKAQISAVSTVNDFHLSVTAKRDTLAETLSLAWEMLRRPFIDEAQIREYVVSQEGKLRALNDDPQGMIKLETSRMLFPEGDPRRMKPVELQLEELVRLTPDSLFGFHRTFFGADRLKASVVGDVPRDDIERLFAPLAADGWWAQKPPVDEPNGAVGAVTVPEVRVRTPGKPSAFNLMIQPFRLSRMSPDAVPLEVASWALFQDPLNSRVSRRVRGEEALSYAVQGQLALEMHGDCSYALLLSVTKPENSEKSVGIMKAEMEKALNEGFTVGEVAAFKEAHKKRVAIGRSDDATIGSVMVEHRRIGRDFGWWEEYDRELDALTHGEVNAAMRRHLDPSKAGLIYIGDFK